MSRKGNSFNHEVLLLTRLKCGKLSAFSRNEAFSKILPTLHVLKPSHTKGEVKAKNPLLHTRASVRLPTINVEETV